MSFRAHFFYEKICTAKVLDLQILIDYSRIVFEKRKNIQNKMKIK